MDIQFPQILFQIINFGVVAGALTFLLYKPVKKMLEERSNRIEEAQKAAEVTMAEKRSIDETRKKSQQEAAAEANSIIESARKSAKDMEKEIVAEIRQKAKADVELQQKQLAEEYKMKMKELDSRYVQDIAVTAGKIIGKHYDAKILEKDIEAVLAKV